MKACLMYLGIANDISKACYYLSTHLAIYEWIHLLMADQILLEFFPTKSVEKSVTQSMWIDGKWYFPSIHIVVTNSMENRIPLLYRWKVFHIIYGLVTKFAKKWSHRSIFKEWLSIINLAEEAQAERAK